jgi:hypothetical protein
MEIWKSVFDYENYEVSNFGNFRKGNKIIKGCKDKNGYLISTFRKNGVKKTVKLHRLVLLTFIPNPENKPQVNHINGIKDDNRLENLEWCTNSENQRHAVRTGLKTGIKGEKCSFYGLKGGLNYKCKKVINIKTNQIYDCAKDVSDFLEYSHNSFIKQLNGYTVNKTDFRYINP